jgi:hypothetical protein
VVRELLAAIAIASLGDRANASTTGASRMIDPLPAGAVVIGTAPRIACIFEPLQRRARGIADIEATAGRGHIPFAVPTDVASHLVSGIESAALDEALREAERHRSIISPRAGGQLEGSAPDDVIDRREGAGRAELERRSKRMSTARPNIAPRYRSVMFMSIAPAPD